MPKKSNQRSNRPKKRKFYGNRFFKKLRLDDEAIEPIDIVEPVPRPSEMQPNISDTTLDMENESGVLNTEAANSVLNTAFCKLNESVSELDDFPDMPSGYRFIDIDSLVKFMNAFMCPSCLEECGFEMTESRFGVSSKMSFICKGCKQDFLLNHCKENLNLRFQMAMYSIGCHYEQGKKFLGNMNMPPPVSVTRSNYFKSKIHTATEKVANNCMNKAAAELKTSQCTDGDNDVTVSCDGTWQRRGFISKNGVSTVLSVNPRGPPKVIDTQTSSNYCDKCAKGKKRLSPDEFLIWKQNHNSDCEQNHTGTSGAMESQGIFKCFKRSQEKYDLTYTGYLGDGDCKSYKAVAEANPPIYPLKNIRKLECCGHVQKRMGKRLMDKTNECKGKVYVENGKKYTGIKGAGRLTISAIKRIQGHYGGAIRNNSGNITAMKKAIMGIWKHRFGEHEDCGNWCPRDKDLDKANKNKLPNFVMMEIKPIFEDLASDTLLEKCLHGGTQNANESFHQLIWKRCPKTTFVGKKRLEIAVYDATIVYNEGELGRRDIFSFLGLETGFYTVNSFRAADKKRIVASLNAQKNKNKQSRSFKNKATSLADAEEDNYIPGGF